MKTVIQRTLLAMVIAMSLAANALADKVRKTISFGSETRVNGTVVKPGEYDLTFDKDTGAVSIAKKGGKTVVTATGRLEERSEKAKVTMVKTTEGRLTSIALGGSNQELMLSSSGANTGNSN